MDFLLFPNKSFKIGKGTKKKIIRLSFEKIVLLFFFSKIMLEFLSKTLVPSLKKNLRRENTITKKFFFLKKEFVKKQESGA